MASRVRDQVGNDEVIEKEVEELATIGSGSRSLESRSTVAYPIFVRPEDRRRSKRIQGRDAKADVPNFVGKTILAHLPAERQERIIADCSLERKTEKTVRAPRSLR